MLDKYAERRLEKLQKEHKEPTCEYCGKPIISAIGTEYIKTKQGKESFFHTKCFENEVKKLCVF